MQNDLEYLIKLQQHDVVVDELREQSEAVTPAIQAKNKQLEKLKDDLKNAKDNLTAHQKKRKELELEAETKEGLVKKHQGELNSLKSNDAYKAMLGEIENAKKDKTKIEDEILVLMEAVEADERAFKEVEKKFKSDESVLKADVQALEAKKGALSAEADLKKKERDDFAATVPANLLSQYSAIRERRGSIVIVPMVNNACGGCRMNLTTAKANEIKKAKSMILCDSCSRILYIPKEEAASSDSTPTPPSPTPAAS